MERDRRRDLDGDQGWRRPWRAAVALRLRPVQGQAAALWSGVSTSAVSTRVEARPRAAQGQPVACDGGERGGMAGNARGNSPNTQNEGEHELPWITYSQFEWSLEENGGQGRRSKAGQTMGGAVMEAAAAQANSAGVGARPSSWRGGGGSGRGGAALGAWKSGRDGEGRPESTPAMSSVRRARPELEKGEGEG